MCMSGDVTQSDLSPGESGLSRAMDILRGVEGVSCVRFGREDIIRNPLVEKIVDAFESQEER